MSSRDNDPNRDKVREQVSLALNGFLDAVNNGEAVSTLSLVREETGDVTVVADTAKDAAVLTEAKVGSVEIDINEKAEDEDDDDKDDECEFCHYSPCITKGEAAAFILETTGTCASDNKQGRFQLYKSFCREIFGVLGKGNRRQLPGCVVDLIQATYPEKNPDNYTGFQE